MDIGPDKLEQIVRRTVEELVKQLKVSGAALKNPGTPIAPGAFRPDQSLFKTPVLTLSMVERVSQGATVVVSRATVISPLACERMKEKGLKLVRE